MHKLRLLSANFQHIQKIGILQGIIKMLRCYMQIDVINKAVEKARL